MTLRPASGVVAQPGRRALRLRDPGERVAVDQREARELAGPRGERVEHRTGEIRPAGAGEEPESQRRELERQGVALRRGVLAHEPARRQQREEAMRGALRQLEPRAHAGEREPVGRVGEHLDEVEAALGGGVDQRARKWNDVPLLAPRPSPRQSAAHKRAPRRAHWTVNVVVAATVDVPCVTRLVTA
jgi:hypothetical protein